MAQVNKNDREFINGVWRKVRYLEYIKIEEELIKQNKEQELKGNIKLCMVIFSSSLFIILTVLLIININAFSLIISGIVLLSAGTLYDHIQINRIYRGDSYGNYDK